jgi:periplasmic copper chaperone A
MSIRRWGMVALSALIVALASFDAGPAKSSDSSIKVENAWVRESPIGGTSGGGYMKIINSGREADRLISAESSVAKSIVLKQMSYVGDTLVTRTMEKGIEIPPNSTVQFQWQAFHLLFEDLKEPFMIDKDFAAKLNFEKAGPVTIQFYVRPRIYW